MCPLVSVFHISVHWSFNVDKCMQTLTVNWLKIQSKWLLSGAWFYALNSQKKIVCRLGSAGPAAVYTLQRSHRPSSWIMGEGSEREDGRAGGGEKGRGRKGQRRRRSGLRGRSGRKGEREGEGGVSPPNGNTGYGPAQRHTLDVEHKCLNGVN